MYSEYAPLQKLDVSEESIYFVKGVFTANLLSIEQLSGKTAVRNVIEMLELPITNATIRNALWILRRAGSQSKSCLDPIDSSRAVELLTRAFVTGSDQIFSMAKKNMENHSRFHLSKCIPHDSMPKTARADPSIEQFSRAGIASSKRLSVSNAGLYASSTFFSYGSMPNPCEIDCACSQRVSQTPAEQMWASIKWSEQLLIDIMQTITFILTVDHESCFEFDLHGGGEALAHIASLCKVVLLVLEANG